MVIFSRRAACRTDRLSGAPLLTALVVVAACGGQAGPPEPVEYAAALTSPVIQNDSFWRDTAGNVLYSQGGGVFKFGSTYYWYGVKYNGAVTYASNPTKRNTDTSFAAVTCYSSTDLINWKFENNILTPSTPGLAVDATTWIGRLGVAYNANTKKYVLVSQYSGPLGTGELFATSSTPNGSFAFHHIQTSISNVAYNTTGDQTIFIDDDGTAYLIASSSHGRANLYVAPLRPSDYLNVDRATLIFSGSGREGNAMFKVNGRYYFCSSDLHGWNASHTYYISATNIFGPYSSEGVMGNSDADFSHVSQNGLYVTVRGTTQTTVIYAGDRWSDFAGNGLGYNQWVPLTLNGTTPVVNSMSEWALNVASGTWSVGANNNYVLNPTFEADRVLVTRPAGWSTWTNVSGATPFGNVSGGHTGNFAGHLSYSAGAYQASMYQNLSGLPNGTYTLTFWVKSSGGQATAQVYVKNFGSAEMDAVVNTALSSWTQRSITGVHVSNGQAQIGVYTVASANQWIDIDDYSFVRTGS